MSSEHNTMMVVPLPLDFLSAIIGNGHKSEPLATSLPSEPVVRIKTDAA
jgi:hypothetical protein